MNIVGLCWYIAVVLVLMSGLTLLITYAPGVEHLGMFAPTIFGCGAMATAGLAIILGRLPSTHWVHRSRLIWAGFVTVAVTVTVLLVLVG